MASAYWDGEQVIYTGSRGRFVVEYWAGLQPIPDVVKHTAFAVLKSVIKFGGSMGGFEALNEPTKDLTSLSLPGGLSQSFQRGSGGAGGGGGSKGGGTALDRLLAPIEQYRRRIIVVD